MLATWVKTHYKFEWSLIQKVKPNEKKWEVNKATKFSTVNQEFRNTLGTDPGVLRVVCIIEIGIVWGLKPLNTTKRTVPNKGRFISTGYKSISFKTWAGGRRTIPCQTVNQHRILQLANAFSLCYDVTEYDRYSFILTLNPASNTVNTSNSWLCKKYFLSPVRLI